MKISILCNDENHPVNVYLEDWCLRNKAEHEISMFRRLCELEGGELLFLISCNEIISSEIRAKFDKTLLIHASDLPMGRGWSPHVWQIIEGRESFTVTLLEAHDKVDCGDIWCQIEVQVPGNALWDEVNNLLFEAECQLMDRAVEDFESVIPRPQNSMLEPSYYQKRTPADSEIDPTKSISEQFDLIRICDPNRFPAYFKLRGSIYTMRIDKI